MVSILSYSNKALLYSPLLKNEFASFAFWPIEKKVNDKKKQKKYFNIISKI